MRDGVGRKRTRVAAAGDFGAALERGGGYDEEGGDDDGGDGDFGGGGGGGGRGEEDPLYAALAQAAAHKRERRAERLAAARDATRDFLQGREDRQLEGAGGGEGEGGSARRAVSREIMKNRGLTKYRSREERNPRVHNRVKAARFELRRKGQVVSMRDGGGEAADYRGEATGIRSNLVKSRKIVS